VVGGWIRISGQKLVPENAEAAIPNLDRREITEQGTRISLLLDCEGTGVAQDKEDQTGHGERPSEDDRCGETRNLGAPQHLNQLSAVSEKAAHTSLPSAESC
jgi:hypothetical protein